MAVRAERLSSATEGDGFTGCDPGGRMRRPIRMGCVAAALGLALPATAEAQVFVAQTGCGQVVLAACATIRQIEFDGTVLRLVMENTSQTDAYIDRILMDFEPEPFPEFGSFESTVAFGVWTGGQFVAAQPVLQDDWRVQERNGSESSLGVAWNARLRPEGEEDFTTGVAALFEIDFGFDMTPYELATWSANMEGIDGSVFAQNSDWTVLDAPTSAVPEPSTAILLATGLAGAFLLGRRRRRDREG